MIGGRVAFKSRMISVSFSDTSTLRARLRSFIIKIEM